MSKAKEFIRGVSEKAKEGLAEFDDLRLSAESSIEDMVKWVKDNPEIIKEKFKWDQKKILDVLYSAHTKLNNL